MDLMGLIGFGTCLLPELVEHVNVVHYGHQINWGRIAEMQNPIDAYIE